MRAVLVGVPLIKLWRKPELWSTVVYALNYWHDRCFQRSYQRRVTKVGTY